MSRELPINPLMNGKTAVAPGFFISFDSSVPGGWWWVLFQLPLLVSLWGWEWERGGKPQNMEPGKGGSCGEPGSRELCSRGLWASQPVINPSADDSVCPLPFAKYSLGAGALVLDSERPAQPSYAASAQLFNLSEFQRTKLYYGNHMVHLL